MTDLLTRLKDWETVYPCDMDKPDGNLYGEAYEALTKAMLIINAYVEDEGYVPKRVDKLYEELVALTMNGDSHE